MKHGWTNPSNPANPVRRLRSFAVKYGSRYGPRLFKAEVIIWNSKDYRYKSLTLKDVHDLRATRGQRTGLFSWAQKCFLWWRGKILLAWTGSFSLYFNTNIEDPWLSEQYRGREKRIPAFLCEVSGEFDSCRTPSFFGAAMSRRSGGLVKPLIFLQGNHRQLPMPVNERPHFILI